MTTLIRGYYGAGNFGDDVLSMVAYRAVTASVPRDEVALESLSDDYLPALFGHPVRSMRPGTDNARTLVLGGGGLFHNFAGGSTLARPFESILPIVGADAFGRAYDAIAAVRPPRVRRWRERNIAFGLGLGPFAPGSRNRVTTALTLAHYQGIAVRDPASLEMLRSWGLADRSRQFTDIAFLRRFWMPERFATPPAPAGRVALVLRDWKHAPTYNSYLAALPEVVKALRAEGRPVRIIAFDRDADERFLKRTGLEAETVIWDPRAMTVAQFCDELAANDVIVSARAHGSILGACLGVPTICAAIEPKLLAVAGMLEGAAPVWEAPFHADALLRLVRSVASDAGARARTAAAVERNSALAEQALVWLGEQFRRPTGA